MRTVKRCWMDCYVGTIGTHSAGIVVKYTLWQSSRRIRKRSGRGQRVQRFPAATQRAARFRFSALSNFTGSMVGAGPPAIQAHLSPTVQQETRARFACQARLHIIWIRQSVWMRCIVLVRHWQRLALQIGSMRGLSWVGDSECSATGRGVSRTQNK